mmetsp:Transcript_5880/g.20650  ORF Transcript_5880/g.20650 Transcript_5880/m.20650 type:complete len:123 (-) Transcript_5880:2174-2542(-)
MMVARARIGSPLVRPGRIQKVPRRERRQRTTCCSVRAERHAVEKHGLQKETFLEGMTMSAFGVPPVFLIAGWAVGAFKFWKGYRNTTYGDSIAIKTSITALWPILFLLSKSFRGNFNRALKA